jgi:hypothetical protein
MGNLAIRQQLSVTVLPPEVHDAPGEALQRIQAEYRALPGLSLTGRQAQRLFGLEPTLCERVLEALVSAHVLARTREGTFVGVGM